MARPTPTRIGHFTHIDHLATIVTDGLLADTIAVSNRLLKVDVGNQGIKAQRRMRSVPVRPFGVVADYAPFYFAPRSPMMSAIEHQKVPTYSGGCDNLIYLITTVERLADLGTSHVFTDRNAALRIATFTDNLSDLDDLVDWDLMHAHTWTNTTDHPDRREQRMAECLVYERVPWEAVSMIATKGEACATQARAVLASMGASVPVIVRADWYF